MNRKSLEFQGLTAAVQVDETVLNFMCKNIEISLKNITDAIVILEYKTKKLLYG